MGKYKELKKEVAELRQKVESLKPYNWPFVENLEVQFEQVNELPERWCLSLKNLTPEQLSIVKKWIGLAYIKGSVWLYSDEKQSTGFRTDGYTEITFDTFKRLVLKEEGKTVEHKAGKWYKDENSKALLCYTDCNGLSDLGYGFDTDGNWMEEGETDFDNLSLATEEEVSAALIKEAQRRGYKSGIEIQSLHGDRESTITLRNSSITYRERYNDLVCDYDDVFYACLFSNGKWAEIIEPKEEQTIDWSVPGQLVKSDYVVVLTNGEHRANNDMFSGTVVKHLKGHFFKGHYSASWAKSCFTLCTEPITLQNEKPCKH